MSIENSVVKLSELKEDTMTPRGLKDKIGDAIEILQSKEEDTIKINKVLSLLDEISSENNIQPYVRTQIWNIVSILESI